MYSSHTTEPDPGDLGATVLLADDDARLVDRYATWVRESYTPRVAYSGEEALSKMDADVDVVLLDRRMPETSGDEIARTITANRSACQIALVSAVTPDLDLIELPIDDYLLKPATKADLLDLIESLLSRRAYHSKVQELFRLLSTKERLKAQRPTDQLERTPEYTELVQDIAAIEAELERMVPELEREDVDALFREFTNPSACR